MLVAPGPRKKTEKTEKITGKKNEKKKQETNWTKKREKISKIGWRAYFIITGGLLTACGH